MKAAATPDRYYRSIAPYYDLELADRGDVGFWLALARRRRPRTVLELGVGTGRIAVPLARLLAASGGSVYGLDCSAAMLTYARAKAARSPRAGWPDRLHLLQGDMRAFHLDAPCDLVIAADDPFAHLTADDDMLRALACVARCLAPNGLLVLETPVHLRQLEADRCGRPVRQEGRREIVRANRRLVVTMAQTFAPGAATSGATVTYHLSDRSGAPLGEERSRFIARVHRPGDLEALLTAAGYTIADRWGSFRFGPYDAETSDLRILAAQPPR